MTDYDDPTRDPLPPPFPVGTKLRCKGARSMLRMNGIVVYGPGLEVTVVEARTGTRGTGREVDLEDGDDPFIDSTTDGRSVYRVKGQGRLIFPEHADDWEIIP